MISREPLSLSTVDTVIVDSVVALRYAHDQGLSPDARVLTCSPGLTGQPGVVSLETGITSKDVWALSDRVAALGSDIYEAASEDAPLRPRALTLARQAPSLENVVYKAFLLSRADLGAAVAVAEATALRQKWLRSHWPALLKGDTRFRGVLDVPADDLPSLGPTEDERAPLFTRLRFETLDSILFRLGTKLPAKTSAVGRRGTLLFASENSLLKEAGYCLSRRGYGLLTAAAPRPAETAKKLPNELAERLKESVHDRLNGMLKPSFSARIAELLVERSERALADYDAARTHWRGQFARCRRGRPAAVLTNYNVTAAGEALYDLCQEATIPHVCSQHGTGFELSRVQEATPYSIEAATCNLYLTYSETGAEIIRNNPFCRATVRSVGQPTDLALVYRRRPMLGPKADICYVSNQALLGNSMRVVCTGIPDRDSVAWECGIIENVLARLPHSVLYKPYRSVRYLDDNPMHMKAAETGSLRVYWPRIDLRYLLPNMRVFVLAHAASTLSWCLMSGKPVVYLHSKDQSPLFPAFEEAMRKGCFVFDAAAADFHEQLLSFLSQPIEDIERDWKARRAPCNALINRFFGLADGKAGSRAADLIADLIAKRV